MSASEHPNFRYVKAASKDTAVDIAREIICAELDLAIEKRDTASLMVSGGSSPRPLYSALSTSDIGWERVIIGLVDERWVAEGQPGSNADFIRETLLQDQAESAHFLPMYSGHDTAEEGAPFISDVYLRAGQPFDVAIMGMGLDGHTASWFPGSDDLSRALEDATPNLVIDVDATGCPGAGDYPERATLTLPAIANARNVILFIPGAKKRDVFEAALTSNAQAAPVRALLAAGERLIVITTDE